MILRIPMMGEAQGRPLPEQLIVGVAALEFGLHRKNRQIESGGK